MKASLILDIVNRNTSCCMAPLNNCGAMLTKLDKEDLKVTLKGIAPDSDIIAIHYIKVDVLVFHPEIDPLYNG